MIRSILYARPSPLRWHPAPLLAQDVREAERVIFADEFNGEALDRGSWNVEGPSFWVNNEQQAYIDSDETISPAARRCGGGRGRRRS